MIFDRSPAPAGTARFGLAADPQPTWPNWWQAPCHSVRSPRRLVNTGVADIKEHTPQTGVPPVEPRWWRAAARFAAQPAPASPLNTQIGAQRRFATVRTNLEDYRLIRARQAPPAARQAAGAGHLTSTINDVVLTVVAGGLRAWLLSRGESVGRGSFLRALVPVSVRGRGAANSQSGLTPLLTASYLVDSPIAEARSACAVIAVGFRMWANVSGQRAARTPSPDCPAPPTLHGGARAAGGFSRRPTTRRDKRARPR